MITIKNQEFGGERPLFDQHDVHLVNVTIHPGESALKRSSDIVAENCTFNGKYPFWHSSNFKLRNCTFLPGGRAALWYSQGCEMQDCVVEAPKMFREMTGIKVSHTDFPDGQEMLWDCRDIELDHVKISNCDYLLSHSSNISIRDYEQHGNYTFQYCKNVVVERAVINSKDAFWNTENVVIRDSHLNGEYLAWYSKNLTLINCLISGTQPLCYCEGLTLINCRMDADCDRSFEESDLKAQVATNITSVVNPRHGFIEALSIGEVIINSHVMHDSDCVITTSK